MDRERYQRLKEAFCYPQSDLYRKLKKLLTGTTSLKPIVDSPRALRCKIERSAYVFRLVRAQNKKIIDFGSGFGFLTNFLVAEGATYIAGIELKAKNRQIARFLAREVFQVDKVEYREKIEELKEKKFEIALLTNAISHVQEPLRVLLKLHDILKPNGLIFIEDNNNWASPLVRIRNRRKWRAEDQIFSHKRGQYLKEKFRFNRNQREILKEESYGLNYSQIDRLVARYLDNRKIISGYDYLKNRAPIDPETSIYHENSFTSQELSTILFNAGFIPLKIRAKYFFDFKKRPLISQIFKLFPDLSLRISPAFEILAIKK